MIITALYRAIFDNIGNILAFETMPGYQVSHGDEFAIIKDTDPSLSVNISDSAIKSIRKVINDLPIIKSIGVRVISITLPSPDITRQYLQLLKICIRYARCLDMNIWCEMSDVVSINKKLRNQIDDIKQCGGLISMGKFDVSNRLDLIRLHWLPYDIIKLDDAIFHLVEQGGLQYETFQKVITKLRTLNPTIVYDCVEYPGRHLPLSPLHQADMPGPYITSSEACPLDAWLTKLN
ncbi:EAL domain-containing protein [Aeromonas sp. CA23]|uniref:EAL domain-containing protein n=1 Tax=Aeromonas sp. CA23 TaxID=2033032 RepID=UPI0012FE646A|nr:EAL domain-containing protein [Aeromonas sp. CA23]